MGFGRRVIDPLIVSQGTGLLGREFLTLSIGTNFVWRSEGSGMVKTVISPSAEAQKNSL